jgi:hypothetical protein
MLLVIVAFVSYWRVIDFTFWIDDWTYLWRGLYDTRELLVNWMHFGTSLEFFVFTKLFGTNPLFWQLTGILLRIVSAYAVGKLTETITRSKKAGIFAGILFASTPIGTQSVGWASAHIVLIEVILLSLGVRKYLKCIEENKRIHLIISFECIILALLLDYVRALPALVVLVTILFFSKDQKGYKFVKNMFRKFFIFMALITPIFVYILYPAFTGSPVGKIITRVVEKPLLMRKYILYFGNYLGTLWNMTVGLLHPVLTDPGYGTPHRVFERIELFIMFGWLAILCNKFITNKESHMRVLVTMSMWVFIFLAVHWFFEPRNIYNASHRYVLLSGVGYISLMALGLSRIPFQFLQYLLLTVVLILNIVSSNRILATESAYRSRLKVDAVWNVIDSQVPKDAQPKIFFYSGEQPAKSNILDLSGAIPYAILRHIGSINNWPHVMNDYQEILSVICGSSQNTYRVALEHIYGWHVYNNGNVVNTSHDVQETLRREMGLRDCAKGS